MPQDSIQPFRMLIEGRPFKSLAKLIDFVESTVPQIGSAAYSNFEKMNAVRDWLFHVFPRGYTKKYITSPPDLLSAVNRIIENPVDDAFFCFELMDLYNQLIQTLNLSAGVYNYPMGSYDGFCVHGVNLIEVHNKKNLSMVVQDPHFNYTLIENNTKKPADFLYLLNTLETGLQDGIDMSFGDLMRPYIMPNNELSGHEKAEVLYHGETLSIIPVKFDFRKTEYFQVAMEFLYQSTGIRNPLSFFILPIKVKRSSAKMAQSLCERPIRVLSTLKKRNFVNFRREYIAKQELGRDRWIHAGNLCEDLVASLNRRQIEGFILEIEDENPTYLLNSMRRLEFQKELYDKLQLIISDDKNIIGHSIPVISSKEFQAENSMVIVNVSLKNNQFHIKN